MAAPIRSTTHVTGIAPSASFFRPIRPQQQDQLASRPQDDPDFLPLSNISKRHSASSGSIGALTESVGDEHNNNITSLKNLKQSREPLLPIGERPGVTKGHAIVRDRSTPLTNSGPFQTTNRLMRNSLDKVLSIKRGLSFDSTRRGASGANSVSASVNHLPPPPQSPRLQTADGKLHDEETAIVPISSLPRYKDAAREGAEGQYSFEDHPHSSRSPSPASFTAIPPTRLSGQPPLNAVPIIDPATHKPVYNYQLLPSRNRFFLRGRLLTGGDSPLAFIGLFCVVLLVAGFWFGATAPWWWHNVTPAVPVITGYLALVVISSMLYTATCDPGILPRNLDPDPPYPSTSPSDGGVRAPMPRDLRVRADVVRVKYCPTCKTYRPPRSSHCKMCDNCVDGCDHHCQWVNNCIGKRNYASFFMLLFFATLTLILIICTTALHLYLLTRRESVDFRGSLSRAPGSAVAFCLSIVIIWPAGALLSYHMRLLLLNVTTIEQIRNQAHKTLVPGPAPPNPFSHGNWRRNLMAVLCRPAGYSWLDATSVATEDKRELNPGMVVRVAR